tara:strand:- start:423 stop:1727 length:1305 start_codon:yes stop_codon:yes gene_type:complete
MATEKLKVFHSSGATSTAASTTVSLLTTASDTQAVVKNVQFTATDPNYPVTTNVKSGSHTYASKTGAAPTGSSDNLEGSMIVDVSSSASVEFDTGPTLYTTGYADARYFSGQSNSPIIKVADGTSTPRVDGAVLTHNDSVGDFTQTNSGSYQDVRGYSAFGFLDSSGNKFYCRVFSNIVYMYNDVGTRVNSSITYQLLGSTPGACTDGVYFYGVRNSSGATVPMRRIKISDGSVTDITISPNTGQSGQNSNAGSFTLYHDGFVYARQSVGSQMRKINVVSGACTHHALPDYGNYGVGALITKAANGKFYLVEVGGASANQCVVIDLSDMSYQELNCTSLSASTEYGNAALEIQPGVALFFYQSDYLWVDVNSMTANTSTIGSVSSFLSGLSTINSNYDGASFANIPIYQLQGAARARSTTYKAYADGVLIEGVE